MTEMESDTDTMSPATIKSNQLGLPRTSDMCYLSPFSSVGRGDRTISDESNLSSSGYSSMASPAPSRCGSSNPLYPTMNDTDDSGGGGSGGGSSGGGNSGASGPSGISNKCRKMRSNSMQNGKSSDSSNANCSKDAGPTDQCTRNKTRSDSETLSDDILLESNDEGIETDHIDEKLDGAQMKCTGATELEQPCVQKEPTELGSKILSEEQQQQQSIMSKLQLPTIVIQNDGTDKSPVSSRSESPISERASGSKRFSPQFYNSRKEQILPFTDSDGLYDFPSSDGKANSTNESSAFKRNSTRKRERKLSRGAPLSMSPTKINCMDVTHPNSNQPSAQQTIRKSPKKRPLKRYTMVSSSSSTESLASDTKARFGLYLKGKSLKRSDNDSEKEAVTSTASTATTMILKPIPLRSETVAIIRPFRKINRLRAIGNQIRFLRRIQHSLRARARSQQDCISSRSSGDDDDNIDDSLPSDPWTPPQANATADVSAIDTDSPSAIQSKSPESYSPPSNQSFVTKTTRSLSLNASPPSSSQIKSLRKDTYLDEATSD